MDVVFDVNSAIEQTKFHCQLSPNVPEAAAGYAVKFIYLQPPFDLIDIQWSISKNSFLIWLPLYIVYNY